jgi:hypothetical protein
LKKIFFNFLQLPQICFRISTPTKNPFAPSFPAPDREPNIAARGEPKIGADNFSESASEH